MKPLFLIIIVALLPLSLNAQISSNTVFNGTYITNIAFTNANTVTFELTNTSGTTFGPFDLSTAVQVSFTGSGTLTVDGSANTNVTISANETESVTYQLNGTPTSPGTIMVTFSFFDFVTFISLAADGRQEVVNIASRPCREEINIVTGNNSHIASSEPANIYPPPSKTQVTLNTSPTLYGGPTTTNGRIEIKLNFAMYNSGGNIEGGTNSDPTPSVLLEVFVNNNNSPVWSAKSPEDNNVESGDVPNWNRGGRTRNTYPMGESATATIVLTGVNRINSIELRSSIVRSRHTSSRSSDSGNMQITSVEMCDRR